MLIYNLSVLNKLGIEMTTDKTRHGDGTARDRMWYIWYYEQKQERIRQYEESKFESLVKCIMTSTDIPMMYYDDFIYYFNILKKHKLIYKERHEYVILQILLCIIEKNYMKDKRLQVNNILDYIDDVFPIKPQSGNIICKKYDTYMSKLNKLKV